MNLQSQDSIAANTAVPPLALIVEDDPTALTTRKDLFESQGFLTITAADYEQAVDEFSTTSAIDIVVTDLDLGHGTDERSGFDVANACARLRPGIPIVAYSGAVEQDDVASNRWDVFKDHTVNKASPSDTVDSIRSRINEWMNLARLNQRERIHNAFYELSRIQRKYEIASQDLEHLRTFLPGLLLPSHSSLSLPAESSVDEILDAAKLEMELIEPGRVWKTKTGGDSATLATIAIWIHMEADCFIAELFSHPSLFFYADTKEDATDGLLELMCGFHEDFSSGIVLSHELEKLRNYLNKVFGSSNAADNN